MKMWFLPETVRYVHSKFTHNWLSTHCFTVLRFDIFTTVNTLWDMMPCCLKIRTDISDNLSWWQSSSFLWSTGVLSSP